SLDAEGNLYAVNSGPGTSAQKLRKVFRIPKDGTGPGGYGAAELIDDAVLSADLQDTRYVRTSTPGGLQAGDLLVLSARPSRILRYADAAACPTVPVCVAGRSEFIGSAAFGRASPRGMAFAPDGNLLVSTSAGDILRFSPTGEPLGNFVSGVGNGLAKIAL